MLKAYLTEKVDIMQKQMGNVSRETETLRKKMLEIKNPVTEMKTVFDGLINTLDTAEKRISKLEEMSRNFRN